MTPEEYAANVMARFETVDPVRLAEIECSHVGRHHGSNMRLDPINRVSMRGINNIKAARRRFMEKKRAATQERLLSLMPTPMTISQLCVAAELSDGHVRDVVAALCEQGRAVKGTNGRVECDVIQNTPCVARIAV